MEAQTVPLILFFLVPVPLRRRCVNGGGEDPVTFSLVRVGPVGLAVEQCGLTDASQLTAAMESNTGTATRATSSKGARPMVTASAAGLTEAGK